MNKRILTVIATVTILVLTTAACSLTAAPPTATPTLAPPTATLKPTNTPVPTVTPTPTQNLSCTDPETEVYKSTADAIWGGFLTVDKEAGAHFVNGKLVNAPGPNLGELSKMVLALADKQSNLTVPPIYIKYNDLSVKTMTVYAQVLDDANKKDFLNLNIDIPKMQAYWKQTDLAWWAVYSFCGWPTPVAPPPSPTT